MQQNLMPTVKMHEWNCTSILAYVFMPLSLIKHKAKFALFSNNNSNWYLCCHSAFWLEITCWTQSFLLCLWREVDVSCFWWNCTSIHLLCILRQATGLGCHGGFAREGVRSLSNFRNEISSPIATTSSSQTYYSSVIYTHFQNKCDRISDAVRPKEQ